MFYDPKRAGKADSHQRLYRYLDPALERYRAMENDEGRENWRRQLQAIVRLYSFMSQVMPFTEGDFEKRYSFGRFLLKRLPRREGERFELDGEAELEYYRLTRIGEADVELVAGEAGEVRNPTAVGTRAAVDEEVALSTIINRLNELLGTDFTDADRLFIENMIEAGKADLTVRERAQANTHENFALSIKDMVQNLVIDGLDRHDQLATRYLNEEDFKREIFEHVARRIYDELRRTG